MPRDVGLLESGLVILNRRQMTRPVPGSAPNHLNLEDTGRILSAPVFENVNDESLVGRIRTELLQSESYAIPTRWLTRLSKVNKPEIFFQNDRHNGHNEDMSA